MGNIFGNALGLASITDDKPVRLVIPQFNDGKLLITKIDGGVRPNFQIMYSLGADVFINAFNQRLSMWTLHGLYIPALCAKGGVRRIGEEAKANGGEPAFVDLYRRFNIRSDGPPLDMAFNGIVIVGFFIEMKIMEYTQEGVDGFAWETPFLGRMNNLLEAPDPIKVADAAAPADPDAPKEVRKGKVEAPKDRTSVMRYGVAPGVPDAVGTGKKSWDVLLPEIFLPHD